MSKFSFRVLLFLFSITATFGKDYKYDVVKKDNNFVIIKINEEKEVNSSERKNHVLKSQESLFDVAEKYKITVEDILEINGMKNRTGFKPGQIIYLEK